MEQLLLKIFFIMFSHAYLAYFLELINTDGLTNLKKKKTLRLDEK